jgi:hypothetical protein
MAPGALRAAGAPGIGTAIFAEDTPMEEVERKMTRLLGLSSALRYELNDRWGGLASGDYPVNLTYSFPPDGTNIGNFATIANGAPVQGSWVESGETTSSMFSRWDAAFGGTNGSVWKPLFRQAFDRWEELTGNRYTEVPDDGVAWPGTDGPFNGGSGRGDIRITSALDDGSGGTLAFNFYPDTGDMLLDSGDLLSTRFLSSANNYRYLRNVIMHEHGHGFGLAHVCPRDNTKLMEPFASTQFDGPQLDDRLGAQRTYGDTFEPNNSTTSSAPAAQTGIDIANSSPQTIQNLSLSNSFDADYFRFTTVSGAYSLSVTASPVSSTYTTGPQTSQCNTGASFNSALGADLQLEVLDSLGTVMQSRNDNGLGMAESINDLQLANPGTYHIRVVRASGAAFNDIQPYNIALVIEPIGFSADISGDGCVNGSDLAILLAQWGPNPGSPSDLNTDGVVDGYDLSIFLTFWAPCN